MLPVETQVRPREFFAEFGFRRVFTTRPQARNEGADSGPDLHETINRLFELEGGAAYNLTADQDINTVGANPKCA